MKGSAFLALAVLVVAGTMWMVGRSQSPSELVQDVSPPAVFHGERSRGPATGPLKVCKGNPRYFCDPAGKAVYLTGSHNWYNLQDGGKSDPPPRFDFGDYLDFLVSHNHNFIRLWTSELTKSDGSYRTPLPWMRTGPGMALDGKPRFDLNRFNQAYFDRLRSRIIAAGERGIYVSVMLFEGYGLQFGQWAGHPFNARNNINGVDGNKLHSSPAAEVDSLLIPKVNKIQEAYVLKVIETVSDLDNVLYEISNEAGPYSTAWQYHMIRYIKSLEADRPKQHPIGMTFQFKGGTTSTLFASPADWISPGPRYKANPPVADGRKVIISDTDHLWGIGGDPDWVWKSFMRGLNPIYMDDMTQSRSREEVRLAMGQTLAYANRVNLLNMLPHGKLASSGYCLARPGFEYLAYAPEGGVVIMQLGGTSATYHVEWFNPQTGRVYDGGAVQGGRRKSFLAPFSGAAVLYLKSE